MLIKTNRIEESKKKFVGQCYVKLKVIQLGGEGLDIHSFPLCISRENFIFYLEASNISIPFATSQDNLFSYLTKKREATKVAKCCVLHGLFLETRCKELRESMR